MPAEFSIKTSLEMRAWSFKVLFCLRASQHLLNSWNKCLQTASIQPLKFRESVLAIKHLPSNSRPASVEAHQQFSHDIIQLNRQIWKYSIKIAIVYYDMLHALFWKQLNWICAAIKFNELHPSPVSRPIKRHGESQACIRLQYSLHIFSDCLMLFELLE